MKNSNTKISVCMVQPIFPPDFAGAAKQSLALVRHLKKMGTRVLVITGRHSKRPIFDKFEAIPVIRIPVWGSEMIKTILFNLAALPLLLIKHKKYDLIHLHSLNGLYSAILIRFLLGKKVIYKMTNCSMDDPISLKKQPGGRLKFKFFSKTDCAVAVSQDGLDSYRQTRLPVEKCVWIPNGVDTLRFKPLAPAEKVHLRKKFRLEQDATILIYSGNINPAKGVHRIVAAMKILVPESKNLFCIILGPVHDDVYFREMKKEIADAGLEPYFRFTGQVENVVEYLQAADIFVFPSDHEGMPNALLEAMSVGLACVASQISGCTDAIVDNQNGFLFASDDLKRLSKCLRILISHPDLKSRFGQNARKSIRENFALEVVARRYQQLYLELLENNSNN
jgi:glycosyltransferase involved in cell wall biosynthesis